MGKTNLGLKMNFEGGDAVLSFGCVENEPEGSKNTVGEIILSVADKEGKTATLRLKRSEAMDLARRLLVGSVELKRGESMPQTSSMLAFCNARGFDNSLDDLLKKCFGMF